jgi:hypothetical protein
MMTLSDEEAYRRAQAIGQDAPRDALCAYCHGTGRDPGEPPFDMENPLPVGPAEVREFTSRRFKRLMRAGARRALHLVNAQANGLRSEGARQFDAAELAFVRFGLALLQRYVGELVAERDKHVDIEPTL